jgi:hypothetical protein
LPGNNRTVLPRLHREFFDLVKQIEEHLKVDAGIDEADFKPILDTAINNYLSNGQLSFKEYFVMALKDNIDVYNLVPEKVLRCILDNN